VNKDGRIRFEAGRKEHVDAVLSMMRGLEDADPGPSPFDEERRRRNWELFVKDSSLGRAWIICEGARPVGYVVLTLGFSFEYGGRDGFLDELYVDAKYRGRGIGRQAMEFVEEQAREMGVNALHLEATHGNEPAIELYRRAGYFMHERFLMTKRVSDGTGGERKEQTQR
jgi:ribosomal protein S18 acetylase RimI-like enzyme